jgi:hypothetical protein
MRLFEAALLQAVELGSFYEMVRQPQKTVMPSPPCAAIGQRRAF